VRTTISTPVVTTRASATFRTQTACGFGFCLQRADQTDFGGNETVWIETE
jgi:hypothetical protein